MLFSKFKMSLLLTICTQVVYTRVRNHDRNRARFARFSRQNFCRFFSWVNNFWCIFWSKMIFGSKPTSCTVFVAHDFCRARSHDKIFVVISNPGLKRLCKQSGWQDMRLVMIIISSHIWITMKNKFCQKFENLTTLSHSRTPTLENIENNFQKSRLRLRGWKLVCRDYFWFQTRWPQIFFSNSNFLVF